MAGVYPRVTVPPGGTLGGVEFVTGPMLALVVVGLLALFLRWAFGPTASLVAPPPRPGPPEAYGLLVPVAQPTDEANGAALRALLGRAGVRAALVPTRDGLRLMVFPDDASRARRLLAAAGGEPDGS